MAQTQTDPQLAHVRGLSITKTCLAQYRMAQEFNQAVMDAGVPLQDNSAATMYADLRALEAIQGLATVVEGNVMTMRPNDAFCPLCCVDDFMMRFSEDTNEVPFQNEIERRFRAVCTGRGRALSAAVYDMFVAYNSEIRHLAGDLTATPTSPWPGMRLRRPVWTLPGIIMHYLHHINSQDTFFADLLMDGQFQTSKLAVMDTAAQQALTGYTSQTLSVLTTASQYFRNRQQRQQKSLQNGGNGLS